MENWQEATIVLCIAIVGVIYLIVSRTSKEQDKKDDSVARHLVPQ
jgi:preprotein translocase subunit YajC